ncbi:TIM barrel protein [Propionivibrio soli]|uniref:TIM barrel protein n=1 Tax=Propionivibrio soli TaxID=2976531 RepID=UPI0021E79A1A|nr:TIM barrel protein [Propionivibrio soli]
MSRIRFSINRISSPRISFDAFLAMCNRLGVDSVEIRNDLPGTELQDGTPAPIIKNSAAAAHITVRTINALYPFDVFTPELREKAVTLAKYAKESGAEALVMCPLNDWNDKRTPAERYADLVRSLCELRPILEDAGLLGLVEPLGFQQCSLRRKSDAIKAIYDAGAERAYRLVHDTFHHYLSGEDIFYPDMTGLIHISGVEDKALQDADMRDEHRVLVGTADRLGNLRQLKIMLDRGYQGVVSFEPFAPEIMDASDSESRLRASMDFVRANV